MNRIFMYITMFHASRVFYRRLWVMGVSGTSTADSVCS